MFGAGEDSAGRENNDGTFNPLKGAGIKFVLRQDVLKTSK